MYPEYESDEQLLFAESFFQHAAIAISSAGIEKLYPHMSINELAVIHNYTKQGYRPLNENIRAGAIDNQTSSNIRFLNYALSKLNAYNGITYRGTTLSDSVAKEFEQLALLQKIYKQKFYLSTSTDINTAFAFAEKGSDLHKTIFSIVSKSGKDIEGISDWGPYFRKITE